MLLVDGHGFLCNNFFILPQLNQNRNRGDCMGFWVSTVVPLMTTLYGALRLVLVVLAILALIKDLKH